MKIYSHTIRETCDVYAIVIRQDELDDKKENVSFYISDNETIGLGIERFDKADIVDPHIASDFYYTFEPKSKTSVILWNYFEDLDQLDLLMEFESGAVDAFEKARAVREAR